MEENKIVELNANQAEEKNELTQAPQEEAAVASKKEKIPMKVLKTVGKCAMYVGIGALTVLGVSAVIGMIQGKNEDDSVDVVVHDDGSFTVQDSGTSDEGSTDKVE